jgi:5'(3')-deoxyribonucleotidase
MKQVLVTAMCLSAIIAVSCTKKQNLSDYATISFFIGDVSKNGGGGVAIGDPVTEKDTITTGPQSSCDIKIGESIIRVKEKSKMAFSTLSKSDKNEQTSLDLNEGRLLCKPKKLLKDDSFMVKTPTAIAAVRGTEFTVESDANKTTRIKVFDGKVKVAKRIKQFEENISNVVDVATPIEKKESVIITEKEVAETEKKIDKVIADNKGADIASVITKTQSDVAIGQKDVKQFKVEDFSKEGSELIAVKEKEPEVIKQIKEVIKKDEKPTPEGRLLITKYEVYFVKNGRVEWEGKVIEPPVKEKDKIYIASEDYVFCASIDGPVFWKKEIINDGKVEVKGKETTIYIKGKAQLLDSETGKEKF